MVTTMAFWITLGKLFIVTLFVYLLIGWLAKAAGANEKVALAAQIIAVLISVLSAIDDASRDPAPGISMPRGVPSITR